MVQFVFSPGITLALALGCWVGVPLALVVGLAWKGRAGFRWALSGSTLLLGAYKTISDAIPNFATDHLDVVLSASALLSGALLTLSLSGQGRPGRSLVVLLAWGCVLIGALKVFSDPLDPFDVLLSILIVSSGAWLLRRGLSAGASPHPRVGASVPTAGSWLRDPLRSRRGLGRGEPSAKCR